MQREGSLPCSQESATSVPIPSRMNLVYVLQSHTFEISFNTILPSTLGIPVPSSPPDFLLQRSMVVSFPHTWHSTCSCFRTWLYHPNNIR